MAERITLTGTPEEILAQLRTINLTAEHLARQIIARDLRALAGKLGRGRGRRDELTTQIRAWLLEVAASYEAATPSTTPDVAPFEPTPGHWEETTP